jgi:hypothetical protein
MGKKYVMKIKMAKRNLPPSDGLLDKIGLSFGNGKMSDIKVMLGSGTLINCHRYILALRSDVFTAMLSSDPK